MKKSITAAQAINNFKLLLELSSKNSYQQYRAAVQQIAAEVIERGITTAEEQEPEENPRFVWIIGSIRERFPDIPELAEHLGGMVLWDRQEKKPVVTVHRDYEQLICLETTRNEPASAPLSSLEDWLNNMEPGDLESEGIPETCAYFHS
jgi:hypothetical protein